MTGRMSREVPTTNHPMKNFFLIIVLALTCAIFPASPVSAQTGSFTYQNVPTAPLMPGATFTIGMNVVFTPGGNVADLAGFSFWLAQLTPASPFPFSITARDTAGSPFTFGNIPFPQFLTPITQSDLGAGPSTALGSGTYFVANLTFAVAANAAPGSYTIGNTTQSIPGIGGRFSVITDHNGNTFPMAGTSFSVTVVPEPQTMPLVLLGAFSVLCVKRARRRHELDPASP